MAHKSSGPPYAAPKAPFAAPGVAQPSSQATFERYLNFSDQTTKDRISFAAKLRAARAGNPEPESIAETDLPDEPEAQTSGFSKSGWDKYHFFSSTGQGDTKGGIHMTARRGRARPAMTGPGTFRVVAFTDQDMDRIRARGTDWNRTTYGESFGQLARMKAQADEQKQSSSTLVGAGSSSLGSLRK